MKNFPRVPWYEWVYCALVLIAITCFALYLRRLGTRPGVEPAAVKQL